MITKFYPSTRPKLLPAVYYPQQQRPTSADKQRADLLKITPEEFIRRDKIVTKLWFEKPYVKGDRVLPQDKKHKEKYGTIIVKDIFTSYYSFPLKEAMEWPDDDEPYTITAESEKETGLILLHPSWLEKQIQNEPLCPAC